MNCQVHSKSDKAILQNSHLKVTPGRLELLDIFTHSKKPLSVKDIIAMHGRSKVDKVTVYRNIDTLEKLGVIKQVLSKDRQAYYELSNHGHHHHVVCIHCGKIKDLSKCGLDEVPIKVLKESGFAKITDHSFEFFGLCDSCAKR